MNAAQPHGPFTYPLVTIDFEASALTLQSFPIEVGIAIARCPSSEIETWSSLIRPEASWAASDEWDPDAERVHGISRRSLRDAMPAAAVMMKLNSLVPPGAIVWCDGGHYDAYWLGKLGRAADRKAGFELSEIGRAIGGDPTLGIALKLVMSRTRTPHRAGPDAIRLCAALREVFHDR